MLGNFVHVNVILVGVVNVAAPKFIIAYYRFWSGNIDGLYLFVLQYIVLVLPKRFPSANEHRCSHKVRQASKFKRRQSTSY